MKDIAVFGLGKLGKSLAITYSNMGGKVIAVDMVQERVDEVADYVTYAIRADVTEENSKVIAHIFEVIAKLSKDLKMDDGFRVVNNCGDSAGQTVKHIHFHLLSGRNFTWPAG